MHSAANKTKTPGPQKRVSPESGLWPNDGRGRISSHEVAARLGAAGTATALTTCRAPYNTRHGRRDARCPLWALDFHRLNVFGLSFFQRKTFKDFLQQNVIRTHKDLLKFFHISNPSSNNFPERILVSSIRGTRSPRSPLPPATACQPAAQQPPPGTMVQTFLCGSAPTCITAGSQGPHTRVRDPLVTFKDTSELLVMFRVADSRISLCSRC